MKVAGNHEPDGSRFFLQFGAAAAAAATNAASEAATDVTPETANTTTDYAITSAVSGGQGHGGGIKRAKITRINFLFDGSGKGKDGTALH